MADLLPSHGIQNRRPTSSRKRTTFVGVDTSDSITIPQRKSIPRSDSNHLELTPSPRGSIPETENSDKVLEPSKSITVHIPSRCYKQKQRGKIQKQPRTIIVHLHNKQLVHLAFHFKAGEAKPVVRVQLVKDSLVQVLKINPQIMDFFGIFSGTTSCPLRLYHNTSLLPENHSHFTLQLLDFNWNENQGDVGAIGLKLITSEIHNHIENNRILPPLSKAEIQTLNEDDNLFSISEILRTHSFIVSNEAFTQPFPSLLSAEPSFKFDIKLGLDIKGIHFFDVTGESLIMTFPWSTISQVKSQIDPTSLFMFDIVVFEGIQFLRSIVVQTSHCEYLVSVAESILMLHCKKPEEAGIFEYLGKFDQMEIEYPPYALVKWNDVVSFKECITNGSAHEIRKIYSISQCISNKAYEMPLSVYKPERSEIPLHLKGKRYSFCFRTFQVIYYSRNTYKKELNDTSQQKTDPDMIFVTIPVGEDRSICAKEVKMAVMKTLHLQKESADLFGLFLHRPSDHISLYLFSDSDAIPDGYYELIFRLLVFNWSEVVDPVQWACVREDENATKMLFWEIMCKHRQLMNEVDEIFDLFVRSCSLHDFAREMGAIADLYTVICTIKKIPDCISELVHTDERLILSMDASWLHLWKYKTGQRVSSWNWNSISTVRRETTLNERVKFEIFVPNKLGKHDHQRYQTLAVDTKCASFVMTVMGYILDGYRALQDRLKSKEVLQQVASISKKYHPTSPMEDTMKLTSIEFEDEIEGVNNNNGVIKTFVCDETENSFKNCFSCQHVYDTSGALGNSTNVTSQFESQGSVTENRIRIKINLTGNSVIDDTDDDDDNDDDEKHMIGVEEDSLCTRVEYNISERKAKEFFIKHTGTNGFRFLKDVLVQPDSRLIDVVGYYWNRNFTGSLGRRHRHKRLRNGRDIISFRSILPEDGLFPTCFLELPQCCFSVSVPHLMRPLSMLATLSQSDGRKYFTCFSTKPYRYRL